jgi:molecular chaperone DnaK (HSP70)
MFVALLANPSAEELQQLDGVVQETLRAGSVGPSQVDAILLAGGSYNLVAVQERLARLFGPERVARRTDTFTSVAQGLAIAAAQRE